MMKKRRILFALFDEFLHLDMAGPAAVFGLANEEKHLGGYECRFLSPDGGIVPSYGGPPVVTEALGTVRCGARDTLIVVGGEEVPTLTAAANRKLTQWLEHNSAKVERVASVCTGSFLLAAAGILNGRVATTHWQGCRQLQAAYPECQVVGDKLYVNDGNVWTSAGVTTGFDMALEMVRHDHGSGLAGHVAKRLVIYAHRPGNQSQFSNMLNAQVEAGEAFFELMMWAEENLEKGLRVADLADHVGMSERTFYRKFTAQTGRSPAKFLDACRLEKAASLLELGATVKATAMKTGFRSEAGFRAAFEVRFGLSPSLHKKLHRGRAGAPSG